MILYVVTKAPVDLDDAAELVGVFDDRSLAAAACTGAGTHMIAEVELNRRYRGDLRNVSIEIALDHRQFK